MADYFVHPSSYIDEDVTIGEGTRVWYFCHIQKGARIGKDCNIGQNVFVSKNVKIGNCVKIQNNVSVYECVELQDYVFCGPSCVFTNDLTPRSKYPKGLPGYKKTLVETGATIGANATIVCGHRIGKWALIGAGAVVTKDVPAYALMVGVPARQIGWVSERGERLDFKENQWGGQSQYSQDSFEEVYELRDGVVVKCKESACQERSDSSLQALED